MTQTTGHKIIVCFIDLISVQFLYLMKPAFLEYLITSMNV